MSKQPDEKQNIEELKRRYDELNDKKIEAKTKLTSAQERLENLKKEAREKYDTDDLEELKRKLKEMKDENERKRAEYQAGLDKIERDLLEVEKKYNEHRT
jgi:hypothetical protein